MKTVSRAPYLMLVLALIGIAVAFYDSYAIYNHQPLWCPPPIDGCNIVADSPYARIFGLRDHEGRVRSWHGLDHQIFDNDRGGPIGYWFFLFGFTCPSLAYSTPENNADNDHRCERPLGGTNGQGVAVA